MSNIKSYQGQQSSDFRADTIIPVESDASRIVENLYLDRSIPSDPVFWMQFSDALEDIGINNTRIRNFLLQALSVVPDFNVTEEDPVWNWDQSRSTFNDYLTQNPNNRWILGVYGFLLNLGPSGYNDGSTLLNTIPDARIYNAQIATLLYNLDLTQDHDNPWQQADAARNQVTTAGDQAYAAGNQAYAARNQATAAMNQAYAARDQAYAARDQAYAAWSQADAARNQANAVGLNGDSARDRYWKWARKLWEKISKIENFS